MNVEHSFNPMTDRYQFDFDDCTYANGWCQVDTYQDASYFGIWTQPFERKIVTYAEGDITVITCDTDAEYSTAVLEMLLAYKGGLTYWHERMRHSAMIDLGLSTRFKNSERFAELGLAGYTH